MPMGCSPSQKATNSANGAAINKWQEREAQVRKGEKSTLVVFWKFASEDAAHEDGETPKARGSHLLFTRGYSVFNAAQVDG